MDQIKLAEKLDGLSRRSALAGGAAALAAAALSCWGGNVRADEAKKDGPQNKGSEPFILMFNTSTIRGQKLPISKTVDLVGAAGYNAIEPWINELDAHVKSGADLKDLGKQIKDHGMSVESAIGFPEWIVDDDARRAKGLDEAKRCCELVQKIGGKRLAAPPAGATNVPDFTVSKIADRYGKLLEVGKSYGIVMQAEIWGFSKVMSKMSETVAAALETGDPLACVLPDVYHLYKGGSSFNGVKMLGGAFQVFHVNDYPGDLTPQKINDKDRVYPGDGVAPLSKLFQDLRAIGFKGALSLELFNPEYYKQDPALVVKTGLEKVRAAVKKSQEA